MLNIALWRGDAAPPFEPPASRAAAGAAGGRGRRPPNPVAGALIADRRTVMVTARVSPTELADWQAMARTRMWTAPAAAGERER